MMKNILCVAVGVAAVGSAHAGPISSSALDAEGPSSVSPPNKPVGGLPDLSKIDKVGKPMLRSQITAEINKSKPKIEDVFAPHLFQFKREDSFETCSQVVAELEHNENTVSAYVPFKTLLMYLQEKLLKGSYELVSADKTAAILLRKIKSLMVSSIGEEGVSPDLVNYMERLIKCKIEGSKGRGIFQTITAKGWEKALVTGFVWELAKGTDEYDPAMKVDEEGNNLLHLAVASGGTEAPDKILEIESRKNFGIPARRMNSVYWILSALCAPNDEGKFPYELAKTGQMVRKLKDLFRINSDFLRLLFREAGLDYEIKSLKEIEANRDGGILKSMPGLEKVPVVEPKEEEAPAPAEQAPVEEASAPPASDAPPAIEEPVEEPPSFGEDPNAAPAPGSAPGSAPSSEGFPPPGSAPGSYPGSAPGSAPPS